MTSIHVFQCMREPRFKEAKHENVNKNSSSCFYLYKSAWREACLQTNKHTYGDLRLQTRTQIHRRASRCWCWCRRIQTYPPASQIKNNPRPAKSPWRDISQAWHSVLCHNVVHGASCTFVWATFKKTQKNWNNVNKELRIMERTYFQNKNKKFQNVSVRAYFGKVLCRT